MLSLTPSSLAGEKDAIARAGAKGCGAPAFTGGTEAFPEEGTRVLIPWTSRILLGTRRRKDRWGVGRLCPENWQEGTAQDGKAGSPWDVPLAPEVKQHLS